MTQHSAALLLFLLALALPACAAPYRATAIAVPGRIQAEDYDRGGPGVAYFDTVRGTPIADPLSFTALSLHLCLLSASNTMDYTS